MKCSKLFNMLTVAITAAALFLQAAIQVSAETAERFDVLWCRREGENISVVMVSEQSSSGVVRMQLDPAAITDGEEDMENTAYDVLMETGRLPAGTVLEIEYETVDTVYPSGLGGISKIKVISAMGTTTLDESNEIFASLKELGDTADYNISEDESVNFPKESELTTKDSVEHGNSDENSSADAVMLQEPNPKTGIQGVALALAGILVWTGCIYSVKRR